MARRIPPQTVRRGVLVLALALRAGLASAQRPVEPADLARERTVSDPQVSPDGAWVAYTVTVSDTVRDEDDDDIWLASWDGSQQIQLTRRPGVDHLPRWSPDGRYLAFLSDRDDPLERAQVWLLDRRGGEPERVLTMPGGVSDLAWSPDGRRLAIIASDPDPDARTPDDTTSRAPKPIVIDRFQFKEDGTGWLREFHDHLYLVDLATKAATRVVSGDYDEGQPSWSPDGRSIAFVSRRRPEYDRTANYDLYVVEATPGAEPRQLTTFPGPDQDPGLGGRAPAWSPDGTQIAYVQGGPLKLIYYAGNTVAVVPAAGGRARVLTPTLDRRVLSPTFTADGRALLFLVEEDRVGQLARVPVTGGAVERVITGNRVISDLDLGRDGRIAVAWSDPARATEIAAVEGTALRPITRQNAGWLAQLRLATPEPISVRHHGTEVHGLMLKPIDYQPGRRYPTIVRVHGGPDSQDAFDFYTFPWQVFAARGYVVLGVNYRGSAGRGEAYSKSIFAAWGQRESEDILAVVDWAVEQGIADPKRLGIGGWSYGGILTDAIIARDHRFKAATSGAGSANALAGYGTDQYVKEYEAELGTPWKNLEKYLEVSYPLLHADRITTPTLFLGGDQDWNVPLINSEQMYQALKSLGRETQLVVYPGASHALDRPSHRRDRMERYLAWYGKYLNE